MPFHPLDPLTAEEITLAAEACKSHASALGILESLRFNTITLKEPTKAELLKFEMDQNQMSVPLRAAFCILENPPKLGAIEVVVSLDRKKGQSCEVISWEFIPDVQPLATPDDCFEAENIVKSDKEVIDLLKEKYNINDLSKVVCDPWSVHNPPFPNRRMIQAFMYVHGESVEDNAYARPIDFVPIIDLYEKKVIHIDKPYGDNPPPVPSLDINYHKDLCEIPPRKGLKPLDIIQPEGASWTVTGNSVEWQKWSLRLSFNYREGLVLHNINYQDGDQVRPIIHRASLVEMAVPYGAPQEPFTRKCAFDVGDYGLGNCTTSLSLGCDCLGNVHYFDAILNDTKGQPITLPKAICMHEEDASILWKHVEYRTGHSEVRRSRRLVLSFIATVVNYEYAFYWYFYQDGTISYEIKLTGELSTNALAPDEISIGTSEYGTMVAPGVNAQFHQHLFCARLDMAVDSKNGGKGLVVSECDVVTPGESPQNPAGNVFTVKETPLLTELAAQRICNPLTGRIWKVSNPESLHPVTKKPVAWKVLVNASPLLLATDKSPLVNRGGFATKNLWVTQFSDKEFYPAGNYPMQSLGGDGLPAWTKRNRVCGGGDADPVIWISFGTTHIPRVEDFPVMPCDVVGFQLKPFNFFNGNPGVDVPCDSSKGSKLAGQTCCAATANGKAG